MDVQSCTMRTSAMIMAILMAAYFLFENVEVNGHMVMTDFATPWGDTRKAAFLPQCAAQGLWPATLAPEFNDTPHVKGVLSMARSGDPLEAQGAPPRSLLIVRED